MRRKLLTSNQRYTVDCGCDVTDSVEFLVRRHEATRLTDDTAADLADHADDVSLVLLHLVAGNRLEFVKSAARHSESAARYHRNLG